MVVYIEERLCKGCGLCMHYCPKSDRRNEKGFNVAEVADPEKCNACKMCEINCPDFVIYVVKEAVSSD